MQAEIDDGAHLDGEQGIDLLLPVRTPMRLDRRRFEDALDAACADRGDHPGEDQSLSQEAGVPTRVSSQPMRGRILAGGGQDQAAFLGGDAPWAAWAALVLEAADALEDEPPAPLANRVPGEAEAVGSLLE